MAREYIVYKGEEVIVPASPSPLEITGIEPNTDVPSGTYKVGFADGGEKVDVPSFKTSPIATNKKVNYSITPVTEGLAVSETGNITWTETVPVGTYVTEGETEDGKKTAQHTLTLNNQA